jgi:hypothetical protein
MRSVAMAAMLLASCGPGSDAVSAPAVDGSTATSSSGGTVTGEVRPDVAGSAESTGGAAIGCVAPLGCGDDCLQWQWALERFGDDVIDALALAPDGTIVAAGQRGAQGSALGDAVLVALGSDGTELYTDVLFNGLGDPDQRSVVGVAVRPDGLVAVLGQLSETPYVPRTMVVELHGADGAPVQQLLEDGGECSAGALAFVGDGGLVVSGVCDGMGLLRKYDADLVAAWEKRGDLPAGLFSVELMEPIDDDVIVAGMTLDRFGLARLRPDGSAAWIVEHSMTELDPHLVRDLAVTPEGDVIAVGISGSIEEPRWIGRFDGAAGLQWSRLLESGGYFADLSWLVGAVVDAEGRIFVTGDDNVLELDGEGEIVGCWQQASSVGRFRDTHAIAGSAELGLILAGSVRDDIDRSGWVARVVP